MGRYLTSRVLEMIPVVLLVSIAAFALVHLVPGDPARINAGFRATPAQIEQRHRELGLDRPLLTQYWEFISGAVTLEFGRSISSQEDVDGLLARRAVPSVLLVGYALLVSVAIAVPLALLAAARRGSWFDQAVRMLSTVTYVTPPFWMALLLVLALSIGLGALPTSGYGETFGDHVRGLTLPAVTMGLFLSPLLLRLLRAEVIQVMQSEYVEAARARGLSEPRVLLKHVLRNSATSSVTLLGLLAGLLLSATVVVEQIFSIPGLGSLLVGSVGRRDFPVVQALILLFGTAVLLISLLTDLVYAALDPRVRL